MGSTDGLLAGNGQETGWETSFQNIPDHHLVCKLISGPFPISFPTIPDCPVHNEVPDWEEMVKKA